MNKYNEIKDQINTNLNYQKFKDELLKSINTNGKMIQITNKLDIDNENGNELDIMELINIIVEDSTIEIKEEGVYGIYFNSDAYSFLTITLSVLKKKNAAILCTDLYNYASINLIYALVHDILKQVKLDGIIYLQNDAKENFFNNLNKEYIKLDLEDKS